MIVPEIVAEICTTIIMRLYHTPHLGHSSSSHMRDKDQEVGVVSIIIRKAKIIGNTLIHNIVTVSLNLVAT